MKQHPRAATAGLEPSEQFQCSVIREEHTEGNHMEHKPSVNLEIQPGYQTTEQRDFHPEET